MGALARGASATRHTGRNIVIGLVLLNCAAFLAEYSGLTWRIAHGTDVKTAMALVGADLAAVVDSLGSPDAIIRKTDRRTVFPVPGYDAPKQPLEHDAAVYLRGDLIIYFFIDDTQHVTSVFCGRS